MKAKRNGRGADAKGRSKTRGKFVALGEGLITSAAWRSLGGGSIRFYIELRRRFNGRNNGDLHLSFSEAEKLLGMSSHTALRAQRELVAKGFIRCKQQGGFHQRQATTWALTNESLNKHPATHDYKNWSTEKLTIAAETAVTTLPKQQRRPQFPIAIAAETAAKTATIQ